MSGPRPSDPPRSRGALAALNTVVIAAGEITGKLASLALIAVLARQEGAAAVGLWIYAQALAQITLMPVDLGLDRWLLRRVAADRRIYPGPLPVVLGIKLALAGPCALLTLGLLLALGSGPHARTVTMIVFAGFLLDAITRTVEHLFSAVERGGLAAASTIAQRVGAAGLGVAALAAGRGVTGVAIAYVAASALALVVATALLVRHVGHPGRRLRLAGWRAISRESLPFATQDVLTVLLFKVDAVMVSVIAGSVAVGEYGAAYRLLEATMFISTSLAGGFIAMFVYLDRETRPTVQSVFVASIKLAVAVLLPIAVVFGVLSRHVMRLFYGGDLVGGASSLRLLAPVVVTLGVVLLTSALVTSREHPGRITRVTGAMVVLNVALNLALIPLLGAPGAALAMLVTELVFLATALRIAGHLVGSIGWVRSLAGVAAGTVAMGLVAWALDARWVLAAAAGLAVYAMVAAAVERRVAPGDLAFVGGLLRRRGGDAAQASQRSGSDDIP